MSMMRFFSSFRLVHVEILKKDATQVWENESDIIVGNDVWIGCETVTKSRFHIKNGAIIGTITVYGLFEKTIK